MKRILALLLLVCCLLTACGAKPSAPKELSVSLENGAAVIQWKHSDEADTYRLYRRGPEDSTEMHRRLMAKIKNAEPFIELMTLKDSSGGTLTLNLHGNYMPDDAQTMDYIIIMSK